MNKDNAKEYLPIVQAMADGKAVQMHEGGAWVDSNNLVFTHSPNYYRIKPEPKLRPWRPEEVPFGAFRKIGQTIGWCFLIGVSKTECWFLSKANHGSTEPHGHSLIALAEGYEHSTDGGKTWHPCGILES